MMTVDIKTHWEISQIHNRSAEEMGQMVAERVISELNSFEATVEYPYRIKTDMSGRDAYYVIPGPGKPGQLEEADGTPFNRRDIWS